MTNRPKVGGRRQPPGGRPPKGNVKFYCYLQPAIVAAIDQERGELSRGEYITLLVETRTPPPRGARGETEG